MEEQSKIEETVDSIRDYVNTRYELAILKASDKTAHVASNTLSFIPILFITIITVLMLSFGLALFLNDVLESGYEGFFVLAGVYLVIGLILLSIRKKSIAKPLRNIIIKELFKQHSL